MQKKGRVRRKTAKVPLYARTLLVRRVEKGQKMSVQILVRRCQNIAGSEVALWTFVALARWLWMVRVSSRTAKITFRAIPCWAHGSDVGRCYASCAPGSWLTGVLREFRLFDASRKYRAVADCETPSMQRWKSEMGIRNYNIGSSTSRLQVTILCTADCIVRVH